MKSTTENPTIKRALDLTKSLSVLQGAFNHFQWDSQQGVVVNLDGVMHCDTPIPELVELSRWGSSLGVCVRVGMMIDDCDQSLNDKILQVYQGIRSGASQEQLLAASCFLAAVNDHGAQSGQESIWSLDITCAVLFMAAMGIDSSCRSLKNSMILLGSDEEVKMLLGEGD